MTSMSDKPFREAARRSLIAAAERLEALPPGTDLKPRLSAEHVLTFARIVIGGSARISDALDARTITRIVGVANDWVGAVRADILSACLRIEADCTNIHADVLNLAAAASPEDS